MPSPANSQNKQFSSTQKQTKQVHVLQKPVNAKVRPKRKRKLASQQVSRRTLVARSLARRVHQAKRFIALQKIYRKEGYFALRTYLRAFRISAQLNRLSNNGHVPALFAKKAQRQRWAQKLSILPRRFRSFKRVISAEEWDRNQKWRKQRWVRWPKRGRLVSCEVSPRKLPRRTKFKREFTKTRLHRNFLVYTRSPKSNAKITRSTLVHVTNLPLLATSPRRLKSVRSQIARLKSRVAQMRQPESRTRYATLLVTRYAQQLYLRHLYQAPSLLQRKKKSRPAIRSNRRHARHDRQSAYFGATVRLKQIRAGFHKARSNIPASSSRILINKLKGRSVVQNTLSYLLNRCALFSARSENLQWYRNRPRRRRYRLRSRLKRRRRRLRKLRNVLKYKLNKARVQNRDQKLKKHHRLAINKVKGRVLNKAKFNGTRKTKRNIRIKKTAKIRARVKRQKTKFKSSKLRKRRVSQKAKMRLKNLVYSLLMSKYTRKSRRENRAVTSAHAGYKKNLFRAKRKNYRHHAQQVVRASLRQARLALRKARLVVRRVRLVRRRSRRYRTLQRGRRHLRRLVVNLFTFLEQYLANAVETSQPLLPHFNNLGSLKTKYNLESSLHRITPLLGQSSSVAKKGIFPNFVARNYFTKNNKLRLRLKFHLFKRYLRAIEKKRQITSFKKRLTRRVTRRRYSFYKKFEKGFTPRRKLINRARLKISPKLPAKTWSSLFRRAVISSARARLKRPRTLTARKLLHARNGVARLRNRAARRLQNSSLFFQPHRQFAINGAAANRAHQSAKKYRLARTHSTPSTEVLQSFRKASAFLRLDAKFLKNRRKIYMFLSRLKRSQHRQFLRASVAHSFNLMRYRGEKRLKVRSKKSRKTITKLTPAFRAKAKFLLPRRTVKKIRSLGSTSGFVKSEKTKKSLAPKKYFLKNSLRKTIYKAKPFARRLFNAIRKKFLGRTTKKFTKQTLKNLSRRVKLFLKSRRKNASNLIKGRAAELQLSPLYAALSIRRVGSRRTRSIRQLSRRKITIFLQRRLRKSLGRLGMLKVTVAPQTKLQRSSLRQRRANYLKWRVKRLIKSFKLRAVRRVKNFSSRTSHQSARKKLKRRFRSSLRRFKRQVRRLRQKRFKNRARKTKHTLKRLRKKLIRRRIGRRLKVRRWSKYFVGNVRPVEKNAINNRSKCTRRRAALLQKMFKRQLKKSVRQLVQNCVTPQTFFARQLKVKVRKLKRQRRYHYRALYKEQALLQKRIRRAFYRSWRATQINSRLDSNLLPRSLPSALQNGFSAFKTGAVQNSRRAVAFTRTPRSPRTYRQRATFERFLLGIAAVKRTRRHSQNSSMSKIVLSPRSKHSRQALKRLHFHARRRALQTLRRARQVQVNHAQLFRTVASLRSAQQQTAQFRHRSRLRWARSTRLLRKRARRLRWRRRVAKKAFRWRQRRMKRSRRFKKFWTLRPRSWPYPQSHLRRPFSPKVPNFVISRFTEVAYKANWRRRKLRAIFKRLMRQRRTVRSYFKRAVRTQKDRKLRRKKARFRRAPARRNRSLRTRLLKLRSNLQAVVKEDKKMIKRPARRATASAKSILAQIAAPDEDDKPIPLDFILPKKKVKTYKNVLSIHKIASVSQLLHTFYHLREKQGGQPFNVGRSKILRNRATVLQVNKMRQPSVQSVRLARFRKNRAGASIKRVSSPAYRAERRIIWLLPKSKRRSYLWRYYLSAQKLQRRRQIRLFRRVCAIRKRALHKFMQGGLAAQRIRRARRHLLLRRRLRTRQTRRHLQRGKIVVRGPNPLNSRLNAQRLPYRGARFFKKQHRSQRGKGPRTPKRIFWERKVTKLKSSKSSLLLAARRKLNLQMELAGRFTPVSQSLHLNTNRLKPRYRSRFLYKRPVSFLSSLRATARVNVLARQLQKSARKVRRLLLKWSTARRKKYFKIQKRRHGTKRLKVRLTRKSRKLRLGRRKRYRRLRRLLAQARRERTRLVSLGKATLLNLRLRKLNKTSSKGVLAGRLSLRNHRLTHSIVALRRALTSIPAARRSTVGAAHPSVFVNRYRVLRRRKLRQYRLKRGYRRFSFRPRRGRLASLSKRKRRPNTLGVYLNRVSAPYSKQSVHAYLAARLLPALRENVIDVNSRLKYTELRRQLPLTSATSYIRPIRALLARRAAFTYRRLAIEFWKERKRAKRRLRETKKSFKIKYPNGLSRFRLRLRKRTLRRIRRKHKRIWFLLRALRRRKASKRSQKRRQLRKRARLSHPKKVNKYKTRKSTKKVHSKKRRTSKKVKRATLPYNFTTRRLRRVKILPFQKARATVSVASRSHAKAAPTFFSSLKSATRLPRLNQQTSAKIQQLVAIKTLMASCRRQLRKSMKKKRKKRADSSFLPTAVRSVRPSHWRKRAYAKHVKRLATLAQRKPLYFYASNAMFTTPQQTRSALRYRSAYPVDAKTRYPFDLPFGTRWDSRFPSAKTTSPLSVASLKLNHYRRTLQEGLARFERSTFDTGLQFNRLAGYSGHIIKTGRVTHRVNNRRRFDRSVISSTSRYRFRRARQRFKNATQERYLQYLHSLRLTKRLNWTVISTRKKLCSTTKRRVEEHVRALRVKQRQGLRRARILLHTRFLPRKWRASQREKELTTRRLDQTKCLPSRTFQSGKRGVSFSPLQLAFKQQNIQKRQLPTAAPGPSMQLLRTTALRFAIKNRLTDTQYLELRGVLRARRGKLMRPQQAREYDRNREKILRKVRSYSQRLRNKTNRKKAQEEEEHSLSTSHDDFIYQDSRRTHLLFTREKPFGELLSIGVNYQDRELPSRQMAFDPSGRVIFCKTEKPLESRAPYRRSASFLRRLQQNKNLTAAPIERMLTTRDLNDLSEVTRSYRVAKSFKAFGGINYRKYRRSFFHYLKGRRYQLNQRGRRRRALRIVIRRFPSFLTKRTKKLTLLKTLEKARTYSRFTQYRRGARRVRRRSYTDKKRRRLYPAKFLISALRRQRGWTKLRKLGRKLLKKRRTLKSKKRRVRKQHLYLQPGKLITRKVSKRRRRLLIRRLRRRHRYLTARLAVTRRASVALRFAKNRALRAEQEQVRFSQENTLRDPYQAKYRQIFAPLVFELPRPQNKKIVLAKRARSLATRERKKTRSQRLTLTTNSVTKLLRNLASQLVARKIVQEGLTEDQGPGVAAAAYWNIRYFLGSEYRRDLYRAARTRQKTERRIRTLRKEMTTTARKIIPRTVDARLQLKARLQRYRFTRRSTQYRPVWDWHRQYYPRIFSWHFEDPERRFGPIAVPSRYMRALAGHTEAADWKGRPGSFLPLERLQHQLNDDRLATVRFENALRTERTVTNQYHPRVRTYTSCPPTVVGHAPTRNSFFARPFSTIRNLNKSISNPKIISTVRARSSKRSATTVKTPTNFVRKPRAERLKISDSAETDEGAETQEPSPATIRLALSRLRSDIRLKEHRKGALGRVQLLNFKNYARVREEFVTMSRVQGFSSRRFAQVVGLRTLRFGRVKSPRSGQYLRRQNHPSFRITQLVKATKLRSRLFEKRNHVLTKKRTAHRAVSFRLQSNWQKNSFQRSRLSYRRSSVYARACLRDSRPFRCPYALTSGAPVVTAKDDIFTLSSRPVKRNKISYYHSRWTLPTALFSQTSPPRAKLSAATSVLNEPLLLGRRLRRRRLRVFALLHKHSQRLKLIEAERTNRELENSDTKRGDIFQKARLRFLARRAEWRLAKKNLEKGLKMRGTLVFHRWKKEFWDEFTDWLEKRKTRKNLRKLRRGTRRERWEAKKTLAYYRRYRRREEFLQRHFRLRTTRFRLAVSHRIRKFAKRRRRLERKRRRRIRAAALTLTRYGAYSARFGSKQRAQRIALLRRISSNKLELLLQKRKLFRSWLKKYRAKKARKQSSNRQIFRPIFWEVSFPKTSRPLLKNRRWELKNRRRMSRNVPTSREQEKLSHYERRKFRNYGKWAELNAKPWWWKTRRRRARRYVRYKVAKKGKKRAFRILYIRKKGRLKRMLTTGGLQWRVERIATAFSLLAPQDPDNADDTAEDSTLVAARKKVLNLNGRINNYLGSRMENPKPYANFSFRRPLSEIVNRQTIKTSSARYFRARGQAIVEFAKTLDPRNEQNAVLLRLSENRGKLWRDLLDRWKKKDHVMKMWLRDSKYKMRRNVAVHRAKIERWSVKRWRRKLRRVWAYHFSKKNADRLAKVLYLQESKHVRTFTTVRPTYRIRKKFVHVLRSKQHRKFLLPSKKSAKKRTLSPQFKKIQKKTKRLPLKVQKNKLPAKKKRKLPSKAPAIRKKTSLRKPRRVRKKRLKRSSKGNALISSMVKRLMSPQLRRLKSVQLVQKGQRLFCTLRKMLTLLNGATHLAVYFRVSKKLRSKLWIVNTKLRPRKLLALSSRVRPRCWRVKSSKNQSTLRKLLTYWNKQAKRVRRARFLYKRFTKKRAKLSALRRLRRVKTVLRRRQTKHQIRRRSKRARARSARTARRRGLAPRYSGRLYTRAILSSLHSPLKKKLRLQSKYRRTLNQVWLNRLKKLRRLKKRFSLKAPLRRLRRRARRIFIAKARSSNLPLNESRRALRTVRRGVRVWVSRMKRRRLRKKLSREPFRTFRKSAVRAFRHLPRPFRLANARSAKQLFLSSAARTLFRKFALRWKKKRGFAFRRQTTLLRYRWNALRHVIKTHSKYMELHSLGERHLRFFARTIRNLEWREADELFFREGYWNAFRFHPSEKDVSNWLEPLLYTRSIYSTRRREFRRRHFPREHKRLKWLQRFRKAFAASGERKYVKGRQRYRNRVYNNKLFRSLFALRNRRATRTHLKKLNRTHIVSNGFAHSVKGLANRLDVTLLILNLVPTVFWARFLGTQGALRVNGKIVRDPAYLLQPGDQIHYELAPLTRYRHYLTPQKDKSWAKESMPRRWSRARLPKNLTVRWSRNTIFYNRLPTEDDLYTNNRMNPQLYRWFKLDGAIS